MTYAYRMLPDGTGYVDSDGVHHGDPPAQEDFDRIAITCAHRRMFKDGPIKYTIIDPCFPDPLPPFVVIEKEIPIEEAKKRYPNTSIPEDKK